MAYDYDRDYDTDTSTDTSTEPEPNINLLRRTMDRVHELVDQTVSYDHDGTTSSDSRIVNEDLWAQQYWITRPVDGCGTAGCFFGWAVMLDGWAPYERERYWIENLSGYEQEGWHMPTVQKDGRYGHVDNIAQEILGLTDRQAARLSNWKNDLDDLERYVQEIEEGKL